MINYLLTGVLLVWGILCSSWNNEPLPWIDGSRIGMFCVQTAFSNIEIDMPAISTGKSEGMFYSQVAWTPTKDYVINLHYPYDKNYTTNVISGNIADVQTQSGITNDHIQTNRLTYAKVLSKANNQPLPVTLHYVFGIIDFYVFSAAKYSDYNITSIKFSKESGIALTGDYTFDMRKGMSDFESGNLHVMLNMSDIVTLEEQFLGYVAVNTITNTSVNYNVEVTVRHESSDDIILTGMIVLDEGIGSDKMTVVKLDLDQMTPNSIEGNSIDLSQDASANCYVAGIAGQAYRFNATVMGSGRATPATQGYGGKAFAKGNAVIAAYSEKNMEGDILWSWHIWVTSADLDGSLETYTTHSEYTLCDKYAAPIMMDRKLGATVTEIWKVQQNHKAHGLHYQWGRKDPFIGVEAEGAPASPT